MNQLDAERSAGLLRAHGYERAVDPEIADVLLFMTCSVRDKAEQRVNESLRGLKAQRRRNPALVVAVLGCVAEQEGQALLDGSPIVDLVVGPRQLERLPELVRQVRSERLRTAATGFGELSYEPTFVERLPGVTARVTVMEGCDFRCTFCVVPNTRGPEACRPAAVIVAESATLVAQGYREILLLGQTVNAYRHEGVGFGELLRRIDGEAGPERLRFVSAHPLHFTDDVAAAIAACRSVVPWVNVPLQSGSDHVLRRMKRRYDRSDYIAVVDRLRGAVAGIALNTDIIVGFPGETSEDFDQTLDVVATTRFDSMFTYKYSPRPKTPALRLADDVPDSEKTRRMQTLTELQASIQRDRNGELVGTVQEVLVDEAGDGRVRGRTRCQRIVSLPGTDELLGRTVAVGIEAAGVHGIAGRLALQSERQPSHASSLV